MRALNFALMNNHFRKPTTPHTVINKDTCKTLNSQKHCKRVKSPLTSCFIMTLSMMISLLRRCIQVHVHTVLMLLLLMMQVIHLLLLLHGQVSHVRMGVAWVHGHHKGMVRMRMWLLPVPHQIVGCREEAVSRGVGRMGRWRVIVVVAPADTEMGLRKIIRGHSVTHKQVRVGSRGCRTVAPATVVIIIKTHCRFGVHFSVSQFHICCNFVVASCRKRMHLAHTNTHLIST